LNVGDEMSTEEINQIIDNYDNSEAAANGEQNLITLVADGIFKLELCNCV